MCGGDHGHRKADSDGPLPESGANAQGGGSSKDMMSCASESTPRAMPHVAASPDRAVTGMTHAWVVRIIESEGPAITRMLWRILGSEADVMDAFQDCWCKLAARGNDSNLRNSKAYAYRTATNIAVEMIRSRSRRRTHLPAIAADRAEKVAAGSDGEPDAGIEPDRRFAHLREAIGCLPAHLRNVVVLRDLNRLSYDEVGRTLGIDPATARVYRRHAVVRLAELLGEGGGCDES